MPLWEIYHSPNAFTSAQKSALVASITKLYTDIGLPAFYVGVVFLPLTAENFYISAKPVTNFVRISIEHIARQLPNPESRTWWVETTNKALAPHIKDRGFNFEWHIKETPFDLWSIEGFRPPPDGTDALKKWVEVWLIPLLCPPTCL